MISADRFPSTPSTSVGTARDARVEFFGVTLLRLPYISFPVGNVRKSGVLFPSIGSSSNSGAQLSVPYYFNIAPNQDLTLTPTWYTTRGLDIEARIPLPDPAHARRTRGQRAAGRSQDRQDPHPHEDRQHARICRRAGA